MDQNVKPGSNWPKLSPSEKLKQLYWFRDENHSLRDVDNPKKLYDQDWFIEMVLDENLSQDYINDMDTHNRK